MPDYGALDDTALAQALHSLAAQIGAAKAAGDVQQVQSLWTEFQAATAAYATRDQASGLTTLINSVHDGVVGFLQDTAATVGQTAANLLTPLLWPLALVAVLVVVVLVLRSRYAPGA